MKYAFIHEHRQQHSIQRQCRALHVSRSGYYDWKDRAPSKRAQANDRLLDAIKVIHVQSREHYGIIKCWQAIKQSGIRCGRDQVARIRRAHDIYSKRRRRFVITTKSKRGQQSAPNILQRDFSATLPNRSWVGDVTFIPTRQGWLYLSVMIDLFSRKIVGWSMSHKNDGQLTLDALNMAITQRKPEPGLIHHTDRGKTYATEKYKEELEHSGMIASMSRKRNCWDNAVAESFFSNLKNELTYWIIFDTRNQARAEIFDYIEVFYNRKRIHQTLNYESPESFERKMIEA